MPLEKNMVRFIDNFSTGGRGSKSAEYFLEQGYAVIFMHRKGSIEPFQSLRDALCSGVLDAEATTCEAGADGSVVCKMEASLAGDKAAMVQRLMELYKRSVKKEGRLLMLPFTSVHEYLHMLKSVSETLTPVGKRAMVYLAAAVSDYYVPNEEMAEHKIQSSDGDLTLSLRATPKCLSALKAEWCPSALIVSFKLETDTSILMKKATGAILKYGVDFVVANLLQTRNSEVHVVGRSTEAELQAAQGALPAGVGEGGGSGIQGFDRVTVGVGAGPGEVVEKPLVEMMLSIHTSFLARSP